MSKKQDHLQSEQSRDKHPEREQVGSPASAQEATGEDHPDQQEPGTGKVANDHNKVGGTEPTQKNQGERTPESRGDRDNHLGSHNQNQARRGNTTL